LNQVASKYEIAPKVIISWKKQFLENASLAFEPAKVVQEFKSEIEELKKENDELARQLGKTTIERDFAVKKLVSLGSSNDISLVEPELKEISIARQCEMLRVNRSSLYYKPIDKGLEDAYLLFASASFTASIQRWVTV